MGLEMIILSEVSHTETNIIKCHLYVDSKNMTQMNLLRKQKQSQRLRKQTYGYEWGQMGGGADKLGV